MSNNQFTRDYYENGIETGISCYTNYRWIPELTIPMAMTMIDYLGITPKHSILDFGAAKGFLVRAFRLLHRQAWGCDISQYAIDCADSLTQEFLKTSTPESIIPFDKFFDIIIAKDVLEHIPPNDLGSILKLMASRGKRLFVVVPLGENGKFIVGAYHLDKTHLIAESMEWWVAKFNEAGYSLLSADYRIPGIKDNWARFPQGNGFFLLESI